jgi:hypothetical protein
MLCTVGAATAQDAATGGPTDPEVFELLGQPVEPGERRELQLPIGEGFAGSVVSTPVIALRGVAPGPTLCLTGGIHGDEVNGIEIVRRILMQTEPRQLRGAVIGVPIANLHGFRRSSRYLPDRRDMNRHFPGRVNGSAAARIAHQLFAEVILRCDALVDFHTGSFHRRNLPQVRADLTRKEVYDLAVGFGAEIVVHTVGMRGTLRRAAAEAGVPAITYEAGRPMEFREDEVARGVAGVRRVMAHLGLTDGGRTRIRAADIFYSSRWVRANDGGIFLSSVELGERVKTGQPMGFITDPISNERTEVVSPYGGRVIGVAVNQVVMPGFAAFHVGVDGDRPQAFPVPDQATPSALDEPVELDERPE